MSLISEIKKRCVHFAAGYLSTQDVYSVGHTFLNSSSWRCTKSDWCDLGPAELEETAFPEGTRYYFARATHYKFSDAVNFTRVDACIRITVHSPTERIIRADWHEGEPDVKPIRPPELPENWGTW